VYLIHNFYPKGKKNENYKKMEKKKQIQKEKNYYGKEVRGWKG